EGRHAGALTEQAVRSFQLGDSERGSHLAEAVVEADTIVLYPAHVACTPLIALAAGTLEHSSIIRGQHPALPGDELLVGVEGEGGAVPARPHRHACAIDRTGGLAGILDDRDPLFLR